MARTATRFWVSGSAVLEKQLADGEKGRGRQRTAFPNPVSKGALTYISPWLNRETAREPRACRRLSGVMRQFKYGY
ncbi:hypothetical protein NDU88_002262 [Pleurodeles waltl]|uniref:Uncharacterized protein n=1 Tax=Pleurodeles waltl TaxID=8319 RepID=A0AAV7LDQ8_PLEWA|nr:hypothetical protein NDU88_002262 [Pleurodeles waltl]